jgi:DNA polymerase
LEWIPGPAARHTAAIPVSTRSQLLALNEELLRLKAGGLRSVVVSDESLDALRRVAAAKRVPAAGEVDSASPPPVACAAPAPAAETGVPSARLAPSAPKLPAPPAVVLPPGDKRVRWEALRELVLNDPVCRAHVRPGCRVVLGVGSLDAKIMFVGEAPGAEEEVQGEPFVGPAGQLLDKMIKAMGLARELVYIGNILNWRPQLRAGAGGVQVGNRPPTAEEMDYCLPFLRAQVEIVQPAMLVALGATAAHGLLGRTAFKTMGEVRGRWLESGGRPLLVTYHPSYLLHKEADSPGSAKRAKRAVWEDLLLVMERAGLPISEKQRGFFL